MIKKKGNAMKDYTTIFGVEKDKIELTLLDEPMELGLVGMVSSELFGENIAIVVEDDPQTVEYDFACLGYTKAGTAPRVMMKKEFYEDLKNGTQEAKSILFHEIGHYANGDILANSGHEDEERERLVLQNKVSKKEIRADAFAVQYLGIECVVQGLTALKQRILTEYADYDEESIQITIKEIDIRISHIEKMEEEKE